MEDHSAKTFNRPEWNKLLKDIRGKKGDLDLILFTKWLFPEMQLRTKEVSGWSGKGMHTTTFAEMFDLPGMREFGLVDISKQELSGYFPEMRALAGQCQFNNCLHRDEPGCKVKEAVGEGRIAAERYISYGAILESIGADDY